MLKNVKHAEKFFVDALCTTGKVFYLIVWYLNRILTKQIYHIFKVMLQF